MATAALTTKVQRKPATRAMVIYVFRAFQDGGTGGGTDVKENKAKRYPELRCRIE